MAYLQSKFLQFHDAIKLGHFNENETLREKRDIIRRKIADRLSVVFEQEGMDCPSCKFEDQGSYSFGTGIKPLDGDFDIDQGLYFDTPITKWPDPVKLKELVFKTVENHTQKVSVRRSCITVFYSIDHDPCYHVDVAIYSNSKSNPSGMAHIAKGKLNSSSLNRFWEISDQAYLEDLIKNKHSGEDAAQFRRVVRYLKRWKGYQKSKAELASITGIALTILVYMVSQAFQPDYLICSIPFELAVPEMVKALSKDFEIRLGSPISAALASNIVVDSAENLQTHVMSSLFVPMNYSMLKLSQEPCADQIPIFSVINENDPRLFMHVTNLLAIHLDRR